MAYCKILSDNLWASGTVAALSSASGLPASNSQTTQRTQVYRSTSSTTGQYLTCDLGSARACDYIAIANLVRQNGEAVELYEGGTGGSPGAYNLVATLPAQSDDTRLTGAIFNTVTARHWKILWTNTGAAAYAEVGYVGLGAAVALAEAKLQPILGFERIDPSQVTESLDGQKFFTSRTGFYVGTFAFDFVLEANAILFHTMWRNVKRQTPFFAAADTSILNQWWLMRINSGVRLSRRGGATPIYQVAFDWEESR